MAIMDVINVGQGDCIVVNPLPGCNFSNKCIMIDTGNGSKNITKLIDDKKVLLFITHHDNDHFGGFKYFVSDFWDNIEKIFLPFHQNELTLIAKAMINLKGTSNIVDCDQFIDYFNGIVNNQLYLKLLLENGVTSQGYKTKSKQIELCCEGKWLCNHIQCLNPPCNSDDGNNYKALDTNEIQKIIEEIFNETFARDISAYLYTYRDRDYFFDSEIINELFLDLSEEKGRCKKELILNQFDYNLFFDFIIKNLQILRTFNSNPNRENYRAIFNTYIETSHDVCTILKVEYNDCSILLTGDASKKVFYRLIKKGVSIKADYLKVPHHGSANNLDQKILGKIKPKVAIISHNNRHFGTSIDSHPNWKILYLLEKQKIELIVTNDVVKEGEIIVTKKNTSNDGRVTLKEIF